MQSFSILTLGCKVNQYESQQIRELLERFGLTQVDVTAAPELVVVNTCCVTHTASAKSRQFLRQARKHEPAAVVICGCLPTIETDELDITGKNIHVVKDRCDLAPTLIGLLGDPSGTPNAPYPSLPNDDSIKAESPLKVKWKRDLCPPGELHPLGRFQGHTRAFLKIQDGCDAFCTYCIIPQTRPRVHSKSPDNVVTEAAGLVASGHKEIVVTGVHVGAYGQATTRRRNWATPENGHLPALLDRIARIPNLARIRLSSLDPADVTSNLLDVFASNPNIMPHLHLSLQSGSDAVLARMCRPYRRDDFRARIGQIADRLDRPAITTDIIVGFPSETDADFEQTLELAKDASFAKMHVFAYSRRQGTAAAKMQDKVPYEVKKERSQILRDLDLTLQHKFRQQFLGETVQVLIESTKGRPSGRAERYFMVHLGDGPQTTHNNDLITVRITENAGDGVLATPI